MGIEIERKFLVANDDWRTAVTGSMPIAQGYLVGVRALRDGTVRVDDDEHLGRISAQLLHTPGR